MLYASFQKNNTSHSGFEEEEKRGGEETKSRRKRKQKEKQEELNFKIKNITARGHICEEPSEQHSCKLSQNSRSSEVSHDTERNSLCLLL